MAAKKPTKTAQHAAHRTTRSAKAESGEQVVTLDRRRAPRRNGKEAAAKEADQPEAAAPAVALERRTKVQRRRQIDPTTCERDYSVEEVEFMNAMDEYKRKNGRMFPTCSEVLEVVRSMGYVKLSPSERALLATEESLSAQLDAVATTVSALVEVTR
jgi:hypothetical protein